MPLYQYRCNNCGHQFSERQRFSDDPLSDCPVCDGDVQRVINNVGIVFKGSGFYVTDNRNGSRRKSKADNNSSTSTPATSSGTDTASSSTAAAAAD